MPKHLQIYDTPEITVTFDPNVCIHSGICLRGLPLVFAIKEKRWVRPELAGAADVAAQVARCPSGALQYRLKESESPATQFPRRNSMSHRVSTVTAVLLALAVGGWAVQKPLVDVDGACADVFKAQVCTWAKTKGKALVEAGAVVPLASIENAPAAQPMVWPPVAAAVIDMPEAVRQQGGLMQLTVYWEAGGHPPGAFMTPHFDFHFYTVGAAERQAMDCKDVSKPASLPAQYGLPDIPLPPEMAQMTGVPALIGLCVPQMGMHAVPISEIERKDAFSGTMVIGYYKGKPIFIEPMLSKAMLMRKQSFDLTIPDVPGLAGPHPTKFHADFDAAQQAYRFTFSAFTHAS